MFDHCLSKQETDPVYTTAWEKPWELSLPNLSSQRFFKDREGVEALWPGLPPSGAEQSRSLTAECRGRIPGTSYCLGWGWGALGDDVYLSLLLQEQLGRM